jgi:hypothetical protein
MTAPQMKRVVRAPIDDAESPLSRSIAGIVATLEPETAISEQDREFSELEQFLHDAAPEDRLDVFRAKVCECLLPLFDQGRMTVDGIQAHIRQLADHYELRSDCSSEAAIERIVRFVTELIGQDEPAPEEIEIEDERPSPETGWHEAAVQLPPLTLEAWERRELQTPDYLLGSVLSTTNRWLVTGPTGIGKTNLAIAVGMGVAAGDGFLHWKGVRPGQVLYVDGEMSNRVVKQRLIAEIERRHGDKPSGFYAFCGEDVDGFSPLNTDDGRSFMWKLIDEIGDVDLVIFDNVMSLIAGNMAEEGPWAAVMPFVRSLTRRSIGQIWIHHTGHRDNRSYGTKTREWQMDTVAILEAAKRPDTDVSFKMSFTKARERAPANRNDFQDVEIALVDDRWEYRFLAQQDQKRATAGKISPRTEGFLEALSSIATNANGVDDDAWKAECDRRGLIDLTGKPDSARALFSRHKHNLIEANLIASEGGSSWVRR